MYDAQGYVKDQGWQNGEVCVGTQQVKVSSRDEILLTKIISASEIVHQSYQLVN